LIRARRPQVRFSRELEPTRTSFGTTTAAVKEKPKLTQNEQLLAEIRALQPPAPPPRPEREPIDLNGIKPTDLLIGAGTYALVSYIAWQGCVGSTEWFEAHPQESSFYVVQRISSIARVVVIAMCALGSGITGIASAGQAALAVQVTIAISRGELDPDAERRMPKRRMTSVETLFSYMTGGSKRRE